MNTEKKLYFTAGIMLSLFIMIMLIYREIPHSKNLKTESEEIKTTMFSQTVTAEISFTPASENLITEAETVKISESGSPVSDTSDTLVNLNTASVSELTKLNGIGEKKALSIVEYRESSGGFTSIDELRAVNGIGEKTFEAVKEFVCV